MRLRSALSFPFFVIPAQAGTQFRRGRLGSRLRGNDERGMDPLA